MPLQERSVHRSFLSTRSPSDGATPCGKAVSKKDQEGGSLLNWVLAKKDFSKVEEGFGCIAIKGRR
jgi:hypothetical protein